MKTSVIRLLLCSLLPAILPLEAVAATFSGNAQVYSRANLALTWDSGKNALTVSCWFRLAVPSGTNLTEDMTILVNQHDYSPNSPFAYLIRFNVENGKIEFVTRGSFLFTTTLIERPYLERWYHVAVVRSGETFWTYVDGRPVFNDSARGLGSSANGDGLTVGGWGGGRYLFGEVQEVAVAQAYRRQDDVKWYMFRDQSELDDLTGYYKLACSTNDTDQLKNFAGGGTPATREGTGQVEFKETDESGEQSAFDSRRNGGRDALTPLSGAFWWEQVALSRPTPGIAFDLRFGYSSANAFGGYKLGSDDAFEAGPLGPGWRHTFETRLLRSDQFDPGGESGSIGLMNWNGSIDTWDIDLDTGQYHTRHKEYRGELAPLGYTKFQWVTPERLIYVFQHPGLSPSRATLGRLLEIRDFNSNSVSILWHQNFGIVTQVVDSVRGVYDFKYNAQWLLTNVSFQGWSVSFAYDSVPRLHFKSLANTSDIYTNTPTTWQFDYCTSSAGSNLLERIIDPRGNTNVFVAYDKYGRKTNQVDALGRATGTEYGVPDKRQIRHTDPENKQWIEAYDRKGHILVQRDPLGNETKYTYDEHGNRTSITEPLGWKTLFAYDDRGNVTNRVNALDDISRWVFHPFFNKAVQEITPQPLDVNGQPHWTNYYVIDDRTGNLLCHYDDIGPLPLVTYTYETNGLVLTNTDANGHTTSFTYDTNGFLIKRMDSAGFATTFAYNDVGWKLAETNALTNVTAYVYDMNGSVVRIVDPLQRVIIRTYDANGNLTSVSDGKPAPDKRFTFYAYDAANQRTQMVDRAGSSWTYSYTPRGKLQRITDPLTNTVQNSYDDANRLIRVTDPLVNSVTNRYDANGNLVVLIDKLGQRWRKTPDRLNRIVAESDPLGNTRRTSYDSAGRIKEIVTPKGYPSTHSYDGRGRLTNWTDAEGYVWLYTYDGVGNITDIEDALHGRYVMTYGPRNERLMEQNQDTNTWVYTYDELMRLKTQEDPNTTNRTFEYDASGRLTNTIFSTGRVNSIKYDDNNNPISLVRAHNGGSTVTGLTYDSLDRVTAVDDALFQRVEYSYDAVSRPVTITYPRSKSLTQRFDALGRLTNQVFRFDDSRDFKTVYEYDRADRLIRRTYPNGVVQTNTFDNAGRLIGLTYSAIDPRPSTTNIALTYAYDKNGNKTESTERGTLDWPMPSLTDERADYTDAGRLRTRTITQLSATNSQPIPDSQPSTINYKYDASGNMTNATAPSQSWTLGYDEDNRTTTIRRDCGLGSRTIVNRYDALGRRIERIEDNGSTRYVLDLAGTMERILCELNSKDGSFNYYVHGPDLVYRVDATGALTCYHADAMANIIALSDGNGSTVAQYAYTPYGRVLGSTNLQSQISNPYLFVGSQGVMHELPELAGSAGDPGLYFMRARYYSAEAGVFLSTDPVKRVGPSWRPVAFVYASANPLHFIDGTGQEGEVFDRRQTYCGPGSDNPLTWLATWYPRLAFGLDLNFYCYRHDLDTDQAIEDKDLLAGLLASVDFWVKIRRAAGINPAAGRLADVYAVLAAAGTSFEVVHAKAHAGRSHGGSSTSGSAPAVVLPADSSLRGSPNSLTPPGDSPGTGQPLSDRAVTTVPHVQTVTAKSEKPPAPAPVKAGSTSGSATITIRWGDTLSGLAREYHTTVAGLMAVNPQISNPNKIYAGASLRLP